MVNGLKESIEELSPGSFLSRLWRIIVFNDGYYKYLIPLVNDYISRLSSRAEVSNTKLVINRSNLHNKILTKDMTWKSFTFLLKSIVKVKSIVLTISIDETDAYIESGLDNDVLSRIWKQIKTKMDDEELVNKVNLYILKNMDVKDSNNRTNLMKKINSTNAMTWKTLVFLLDEVLLVKVINFNLKIEHKPGLYTHHSLEYFIGGNDE